MSNQTGRHSAIWMFPNKIITQIIFVSTYIRQLSYNTYYKYGKHIQFYCNKRYIILKDKKDLTYYTISKFLFEFKLI